MARPRIHDETTGDELLHAAAALLREHGPEQLSVRQLAATAGTSHRAVYALFGSKQGLIDALAAHGYTDLARRVAAIPATHDPVADLVRAGTHGFRAFATTEPALFRLTFEEVSAQVLGEPRVRAAAGASYQALAHWVGRAREAGMVHDERTDAQCCFAFHAACQGLASCELATWRPPDGPGFWRGKSPEDLDEAWHDTLAAVVTGFARPPRHR